MLVWIAEKERMGEPVGEREMTRREKPEKERERVEKQRVRERDKNRREESLGEEGKDLKGLGSECMTEKRERRVSLFDD